MTNFNSTSLPSEKRPRFEDKPAASGDAKIFMESLEKLEGFVLKEVLGSVPEKKIIFLHCHNVAEDKPGILILDKQAFPEAVEELNECISGLRLIHLSNNTIYGNFHVELPKKFNLNKATFVYPATPKHIEKYRFKTMHLIFETPDDYKELTLPHIQETQFSLEWVYNLLEGKKEQDTVLLKDEDSQIGFVLARDLKWSGAVIEQMYYQAIVVRRDIKSIRDLTEKELPLLKNILKKSTEAIFKVHGVPESRLKIHFHYQPSYYHLHVHFRYMGAEVDQPFVYLQQAIANIELMPDFYQRATLSCVLKEGDPLFSRFKHADRL